MFDAEFAGDGAEDARAAGVVIGVQDHQRVAVEADVAAVVATGLAAPALAESANSPSPAQTAEATPAVRGNLFTEKQARAHLTHLGYTDVSDVKDRGYFFSVYLRTPGGALFELAYSTPQGFTIDEAEDELGTHMCIPPHWEDRRSEIDQLEPIDTLEEVKS